MERTAIHALVEGLSDQHILKQSSPQYVHGFVESVVNVCPSAKIASYLQDKFKIPDESGFDEHSYYQFASELTVSNHIKCSCVTEFAIEKRLSRIHNKNVDAYCRHQGCNISVEVKCPTLVETANTGDKPIWKIKAAHRMDNHKEAIQELIDVCGDSNLPFKAEREERLELKLKDYLDEAHKKVRNPAGCDDLNILFVALDEYHRMAEWESYLMIHTGFFTRQSFHPPSNFELVDVVMLSNLQCAHRYGRDHHDWTLNNIFMLPVINRHRRSTLLSASLQAGMTLFPNLIDRYQKFLAHEGKAIAERPYWDSVKMREFAMRGLTPEEYTRYFPVDAPRMSREYRQQLLKPSC